MLLLYQVISSALLHIQSNFAQLQRHLKDMMEYSQSILIALITFHFPFHAKTLGTKDLLFLWTLLQIGDAKIKADTNQSSAKVNLHIRLSSSLVIQAFIIKERPPYLYYIHFLNIKLYIPNHQNSYLIILISSISMVVMKA
jgi:hypothetical protein